MEPLRMTSPRFDRFLVVLCALSFVGLSHAIYDSSGPTIKPPNHREPALPWYSSDKDYPESATADSNLSRSPKWQVDPDEPTKPVIINADSQSWTPWRKPSGSEIEQRTEISDNRQNPINTDQSRDWFLEYDQNEQRPYKPLPNQQGAHHQNRYPTSGDESQRNPEIDQQSQDQLGIDDDIYESLSSGNTKSHKEKIPVPTRPRQTVARHDQHLGVICPEADSTGQFVYPPDCKFFVSCTNGRAFVQPCAPGTLFNPESLECDFPHKVKCYGGEIADFPSPRPPDSHGKWEPLGQTSQAHPANGRLQELPRAPRCPPHVTGLLPHPTDCTKFLQCANSGGFVMDCGPGTVFNPSISVCDWPYNVRGCEGAYKSPGEDSYGVPAVSHDGKKSEYNSARESRKITCPPDHTGLLPHPETCKKFLQCAHGVTYVMDCGPGTAFNPQTTVCDWPYNVPGCSEEKPGFNRVSTTTARPWSSGGEGGNSDHGHYEPSGWPGYRPATTTPSPDWNSNLRPTWRPTWTTTTTAPSWTHHHGHYQHGSSNNNQPDDYKPNYNPNYQNPPTHGQEFSPDDQHQHVSPNHPHHHPHHQHHHHPTYRPDFNTEHQTTFDQQQSQGLGDTIGQETSDSVWHPHQGNQWNHPRENPAFEDQTQTRTPDSQWGARQFGQEANRTGIPGGRRPGQESMPNRQGYGRNAAEADRNVYVDGDYDLSGREGPVAGVWSSRTNKTELIWPSRNRTLQGKPPQGGGAARWNPQGQGQMQPPSGSQPRPWEQGGTQMSNGSRGHFITKEIEVNQGHSNTRTFGSNGPIELPVVNNPPDGRRPRNDTRTNRAFNFSIGSPAPDLQPPFYAPVNSSHGPAVNFTGMKSEQWPTHHSSNRPLPGPMAADLLGSGTDARRVVQPSATIYYPPGYSYTGQSIGFPPSKPSTNLEPPPYPYPEIPYHSITAPSSELQPPLPPSPFGPQRDLQPPRNDPRLPEATRAPSGTPYPNVPSPDLLPPFHQSPKPQFGRPNPAFRPKNTTYYPPPATNLLPPDRPLDSPTPIPFGPLSIPHPQPRNKTELGPEKPATPVKKKIPQIPKPKPLALESRFAPSVPTVSIEGHDGSKEDEAGKDLLEDINLVEPELDVDVLDDKQVWIPQLVFENKTRITTTPQTYIMKIGRKKADVELFNVEAAPDQQEEPPFPSYYIPPVQPLSHSNKASPPTPISGQVVRLRGGPSPHEGYVEVQGVNPGWGVVCDTRNSWTLREAHVVCRQLGYIRGAEMAWQGRNTRGGVPSWVAANSVICSGNETRFQSCKFAHNAECRVERDAIGVRCATNRVAHCRSDEIPHDGQCYHLADSASGLKRDGAQEYCERREARLIDITSQLENDFISEWLLQKHPEVGAVMTSGVGFSMLNNPIWVWGDSTYAKFRFGKWWPGWKGDRKESPTVGERGACIVMKRKFPCQENPDSLCVADYFFWDAEDCDAATKDHVHICKRPYEDIGCTYGKGNQYAGRANVTASGKHCLHWNDPKVAYPLSVRVVNREVRERLKAHNYCRNPNPNKESRPWCFAAPNAEREDCDIPSCGTIASKRTVMSSQCAPEHFECVPGECIPRTWACDGEEDCTNGADEKNCKGLLETFKKHSSRRLEGYDVEKWLNTPLRTCALRCIEANFTCRSFTHKSSGNICYLSDSNIGMTGALKRNGSYDYYEMKERSLNCDGKFVCKNGKCIDQSQVCNGKNDCQDRSDEDICTVENLDYAIRLAGANNTHEGRIEVKVLGVWGQVCDDGFGMINAEVICKELGFPLGALEIRPGGYYGNLEPPTRFMVDQLKCRGNETSLRECEFDGWGVHNCQPEEAVGVVCKTAVDSCQEGHWKCDNSPVCIPTPFICDEVADCPDRSDESPSHCDAPFELRLANGSSPLEGRVEIRHHGIWGTVCDDDFSSAAAVVICRSLGYGGAAIAKKGGYFGPGVGPIWLDEVFCHGNETQLNRCEHNHWGQHNCDHNEDAGVICSPGDVDKSKFWEAVPHVPEPSVNDLLPANCGKRPKDFNDDEDLIFAKVVHGTVAAKGTYPWQASIRVRGHSRSNHWCGAVMLSPLHVLTAAHCLEGYNKGTYFVRAGDYNTEIDEGTEAEANIEDYYIHEDFRKGHRMNNDIALVLLKGRGIPLGKDIMPICLPHENTEYPAGLNCTISGFGSIETGKSTHSKDLRYGWVPILDQSLCRADYIYGTGAISDGMVCAGYLDEGVDTCDGDSGGPLACYHNGAFTLYGITSWGQHCGKANKPGVYVRVAHYRRWIDQKIKESLTGR